MEISIHAISGYPSNNGMRLLGKIGTLLVEILVDSCSTHNFLDPLVIQTAKLKIQKDSRLHVKVANGDKMLSKGKCEEVIKIHGNKFSIPFHVLTLGAVT